MSETPARVSIPKGREPKASEARVTYMVDSAQADVEAKRLESDLRRVLDQSYWREPLTNGYVRFTIIGTTKFSGTFNGKQEFVNKVAISDMFEVQAGHLALAKVPDSDTKPFAEKMVTDHQKTTSELKSLVDSGKLKVRLPTALDSTH